MILCNILQLMPGQMPNRLDFKNMCHNNWHSYGLVTKIGNHLDITRKVPESGEIDDKEIWDLLERDVEYPRFLHVRHNTSGATDLANTHPIDVYYDEKTGRQIVFMHNGTMYEYKSKKTVNGIQSDDDSGPSDTMNFASQILTPFFASMDFGKGRGDLHNPMLHKVLSKFWPTNNRGLLISNDQPGLFLGEWKEYKTKDKEDKEVVIKSANLEYFQTVQRGPEHARRKAEEARLMELGKKDKEAKTSVIGLPYVQPLKDFQFGAKHGFYSLKDSLVNILSDWNFYDRTGAVTLGFATKPELEELYKSKSDCLTTMEWVFTDYAKLYEEYLEIEDDKGRATKMIGALKGQIAELNSELDELREFAREHDERFKKVG